MLNVLARLADVQGLTTADDRRHAGLDDLLGLGVDELVGLLVVLTTLGVADDNVAAAELGEHGARNLTGVGTVVVGGDVLGTVGDRQLVAVDEHLHRADVGERRDDDGLGLGLVVAGLGESLTQVLDEGHRVQVVHVHLPVASENRGASHQLFSFRTAIPGSSLPSMSSREAPPPVEM